MIKGAYIHIPFCEHICYYCDFNKFLINNQPVNRYIDGLSREMGAYEKKFGKAAPETIYTGGGTPTALDTPDFEKMLSITSKHLETEALEEWTLEINPENLTAEKLAIMKSAGVNRLSIGIQTFDDHLLEDIGRLHSTGEAERAVKAARENGFGNISIDLMFGLPGQTMEQLRASVTEAIRLDPEHISIYSLQVEPRTIFFNRMKNGKLKLPGEDMEADMYNVIIDEFEKHGYQQYEISNFAKPGFESRHNLLYWDNEEYYGFGAGAHGYVRGKRTVNAGPLRAYFRLLDEQGHAVKHAIEVSEKEQMEEEMFLGLRKLSGVSRTRFNSRYKEDLDAVYGHQIAELKERGLLEETDGRVKLTRQGVFLGNEVFSAFLLG